MSDKDEPWTADDIRRNAPNWSLQCDGKLLEYMKNVSKTIEERGNRINVNMHTSMLELDRTKIALENATNQLMALQHKQFVENRVYDDDETLANIDNVPTADTKQTNEPNLTVIDAIRDSIETGIKCMDEYFDKVTIEMSDSEDDGEDVEKSVVYRPKDPYKHRPLPYLIGSKEWHEKWHIGLVEEESEESDNENVEERSLSSSPALSVSSNVPVSLSESENPTGVIPTRKPDAQDLFESSSEENVSRLSHEAPDNNLTFRKQSNETPKIVQNTKQIDPKEIITSNSIFRPQKQPTISHALPILIDSDPPELDDTPNSKTTHKPPNLFLDDEDDQDDFNIFDDKPKTPKKANTERQQDKSHTAAPKTSQIKSINLFADDDYDNFDDFLSNASKVTAKLDQQKPESKVRNLFEDDDDDDDDDNDDKLFIQPSEPSQPTIQTPRTSILSNAPKKDVFLCNIFDDNPPDDDFETTTSEQIIKPEASISKQLSDTKAMESQPKNPTTLFNTSVNLFDDDDDDDDIFEKLIAPVSGKKDTLKTENKSEVHFDTEALKSHGSEEKTETLIAQPKKTSNLFSSDRLFDDTPPSDDEQLFSSGFSKKDPPKSKPSETLKQNTGEFYNDFSETVTSAPKSDDHVEKVDTVKTSDTVESIKTAQSTKTAQTAQTVSECNEITSSLSNDQIGGAELKSNVNDEHDGSKGAKRSEFLKKIDAFSNAKLNEAKPETAPIAKPRQPKKLNLGNIDINVDALRPGAKPGAKSVEKSDSPNKKASDEISNDDSPSLSMPKGVTVKAVDQDNVDSSGRLTNLNRNRVKNKSKRVSTRAGRVKRYQHSVENEEVDRISEPTEKSNSKPGDNRNNIIPTSSSAKKSQKSVEEVIVESINDLDGDKAIAENIPSSPSKKGVIKSPLSKVIFDEGIVENDSPSKLLENTDITIKKSEISDQTNGDSSQLDDKSSENENPFSFLEDQDEETEDFVKAEEITPSKFTSTVSAKATPAYIDELPPELDSEKFSSKSNKANSLLSQNALSLFGDDDDDDFDNDEIFATERPGQPDLQSEWSPYTLGYVQQTPPTSSDKKVPPASTLDLFDGDLDNDKIFEPKSVLAANAEAKEEEQQSKSEASTNYVQETPSVLDDKKLPALSAQELFNDDLNDDDDDDGIFGPASNSKNEAVEEEQSPKSLPPTSSVSTTPPTSNEKKLPALSSVELFDDDLDKNDIFGSTTVNESKNETKEQKKSPNSIAIASNVLEESSVSIDKKLPVSSALDLFDDEMDDGNEIFGSKMETGSKRTVINPKNPPSKSIPPKSTTSKASLFGDDDDDSDLFGGPPPLPEPVKQMQSKKPASKIFSDDSSDDDLFGGGGKSAKKNPPKPKPIATQAPPKGTKDNKSGEKLFSDSDDDDLFGAKPKPIESISKKVAPASKAIKEDPMKVVKALSPSSVDNDPLADLLK